MPTEVRVMLMKHSRKCPTVNPIRLELNGTDVTHFDMISPAENVPDRPHLRSTCFLKGYTLAHITNVTKIYSLPAEFSPRFQPVIEVAPPLLREVYT